MSFNRSSGVLLHPSSFPGRLGIGTLGAAALEWLDWLELAGQKLWQVLPLGHTGYGDSPYQSFGAFAGNPLLIDLEMLVEQGWLHADVLRDTPDFPSDLVDYGWMYVWKWPMLRAAAQMFEKNATPTQRETYLEFRRVLFRSARPRQRSVSRPARGKTGAVAPRHPKSRARRKSGCPR